MQLQLLTKVMAPAAAAALLFSGSARAQSLDTGAGTVIGTNENWSATAGRTVGNNNSVIAAEAGWPGIGLTYLKGYDDKTDYGFHIGLLYGFEGATGHGATGLNLAVPLRRNIMPGDRLNVAVHVDPGVSIYSIAGQASAGVGGPVGVVAGYNLDPRLTVDVGVDLPILLSFANPTAFLFGPLFGAGAEYLIDKNLSVSAKLRVGPEFTLGTHSGSEAAFQTLVGVAYNLR